MSICMHFTCCVNETIHKTHRICNSLILIAFLRQQWFREHTSMLRLYVTLPACLFHVWGLQLVFLQTNLQTPTCRSDWQVKLGLGKSGFDGSIGSAVEPLWIPFATLSREAWRIIHQINHDGQSSRNTTLKLMTLYRKFLLRHSVL
jgi:hypothetical protein